MHIQYQFIKRWLENKQSITNLHNMAYLNTYKPDIPLPLNSATMTTATKGHILLVTGRLRLLVTNVVSTPYKG
jgi:hypothetical protein